jgi:TrmH family RNA methyltransferase
MPPARIHSISSIELPQLHPYRTLKRPLDHIREGIFVAEGEKVVRRLLASPLDVVSLLCTPQWIEALQHNGEVLDERNFDVYVAERRIVEEIVGYRLHQGIMAVARVPSDPPLEAFTSARLLVALDHVMHAENVGVVVRNCAAFGVDGIIIGETSCSPYLRRAVRNSMGAVFALPVLHVKNLRETLAGVRGQGMHIAATDVRGTLPLAKSDFSRPVCIVFGNEESGVRPEILDLCESRVLIPMQNNTDSLNVASASAVFLYEAARQRKGTMGNGTWRNDNWQ